MNFGAKKSRRHSERSEESPGRKRKRQEVRGVRSEVGAKFGAELDRNWGEKWQNGGDRYALSENSTVSRVLFSRQKRKHSGV